MTGMPKKPPRRSRTAKPASSRYQRIAWSDVLEVLRKNDVVVLYAGIFPPPDPDLVLTYFEFVATSAWLDLGTFNVPDLAIPDWVKAVSRQLGRDWIQLQPGYYLFVRGEVRGYQTGLIDAKRDHYPIGAGIITILLGLALDRPGWVQAGATGLQARASARVIAAFNDILIARATPASHAPHSSSAEPPRQARHASPRQSPPRQTPPRQPPPPPPPRTAARVDELALAFDTLGVPSTATQPTVKSQYRTLVKEWHPDRYVGDSSKANEAAGRMTQINVAYSVICEARGWT